MMKAPSILIIEESSILRRIMSEALEAKGYSITATNDIIHGLRYIYETPQDVIIMGNNLPMVGGVKAFVRARQASYSPIIVIGKREATVEALEDGVDSYVTRPLVLEELVARVHSVLRRKRPTAVIEELSEKTSRTRR